MLFIADVPVSMTDLGNIHRADVEKAYERKISTRDAEIIYQSLEASQKIKDSDTKNPTPNNQGPKVARIRRHSYEPNLDKILEEDDEGHERDLADIHRERALNAGVLRRSNDSGRSWRKLHYLNNNMRRPRAYTAWKRSKQRLTTNGRVSMWHFLYCVMPFRTDVTMGRTKRWRRTELFW